MGRPKKSGNLGKGKVTPVQIAFIVDQYLSDNNFSQSRSVFRSEASSLISKSPVREAPKSLLGLDAILNEYIYLKEWKVSMDHEKARLEQETIRVQTLLQAMQGAMNAYNTSSSVPTPAIQLTASATNKPMTVLPQSNTHGGSSIGHPVYSTPNIMPMLEQRPAHSNSSVVQNRLGTKKRKVSDVSGVTAPPTRSTHSKITPQSSIKEGTRNPQVSYNAVRSEVIAAQSTSVMQSSTHTYAIGESSGHMSSVAKCMFNQTSVPPPNTSTGPTTPPQSGNSISTPGISAIAHCSSNNNSITAQDINPSNCTIISQEKIIVSPMKQYSCYTVQRSHCVSTSSPCKTKLNKRDVKGRLDFGVSDVVLASPTKPMTEDLSTSTSTSTSTSESEKDMGICDFDFDNLEIFGEDFCFSDMMGDLGLTFEGTGFPCDPMPAFPIESASGSSPESSTDNLQGGQLLSEYSSIMAEVISGKDTNMQGDEMTAVKSITKRITILSPAKSCRHNSSSRD